MIRTPQARRRIIPKTQSGYKLRGAMLWAAIGVLCGVAAAIVSFGVAYGLSYALRSLVDLMVSVCAEPPLWIGLVTALVSLAVFATGGRALLLVRAQVVKRSERRYGEFARDVGDWFAFGGLLAFVVGGLPLLLLAWTANPCGPG